MTNTITRRGLITGLASLVAAPAIVRASSIMKVKPQPLLEAMRIERHLWHLSPATRAPEILRLAGVLMDFTKGGEGMWASVKDNRVLVAKDGVINHSPISADLKDCVRERIIASRGPLEIFGYVDRRMTDCELKALTS